MSTKIPWADKTWNPITGCSKVSAGCKNCYAQRMAKRLKAMGQKRYKKGFKPSFHFDALGEPLSWKASKKVFVCSMGDLFHPDIPDEFIWMVFNMMLWADHHTYLVLTKRPSRLDILEIYDELPNVWLGVSVEDEGQMERLWELDSRTREFSCGGKFVSFEPLLGPIADKDGNLDFADWVILGGENGPGARPMIEPEWVRGIHDKCIEQKTPFFFKGWGRGCKIMTIDGRLYQEFPKTMKGGD